MGLFRPKLSELVDRVTKDLATDLALPASSPSRSVIRVIGSILAGISYSAHAHLAYIERQIFPETCDSENLDKWVHRYGLQRRPAEFAKGKISVLGRAKTYHEAGLEIIDSRGRLYISTEDVSLNDAGRAVFEVIAAEPGAGFNASEGQVMRLVEGNAFLNSDCQVASGGITGGTDEESDASLLQRLLVRIRKPPQGGAIQDYILWALEVKNVGNAYIYPRLNGGPNSVGVLIVSDDPYNPIPDLQKVKEVTGYIEERRPVTAEVAVFPASAKEVKFRVTVKPKTLKVKEEVENVIRRNIRDIPPQGVIDPVAIQLECYKIDGIDDCVVKLEAPVTLARFEIPLLPRDGILWT